jgi:NAD(P)-dependent dehydrogenase (short-subunit alcohol dehydrogenase family)
MKSVIDHYGQLDILVNNAGVSNITSLEMPNALKDFDMLMNINLRSAYQLCCLALPYLEKTKGAIVNNSSICGIKPVSKININLNILSNAGILLSQ